MGYVTSLFARKMVAAAGDGIDAGAMLASVGIDPEGPWDPRQMVPAERYYAMLERMAGQVDVTDLPVRTGASMRLDEYGALGLAFKAATTLGASYARVERYARLWTSVVEYELRPAAGGTLFILHRTGDRCLGMRLSNEATLASAVSIARQVCPVPLAPVEVLVRHPAPRSIAAHEDSFGCPVRFGADLDAILYADETLARPNILGDEGISRYLISQLDVELSEITREPALVAQAKAAIAQALSEGAPKMAEIARGLGLSARSFHRRLSEHGMSFQSLTEETRRDLAEGLLRDERHSLAEIAFLTGFSEQSAFTRAFKRWMGTTPATYRKGFAGR
ncbi:transcriptional regulator, AraC family [Cribrihabitans marinus]|uniref:Transcriptional regulator, AraC family n=1 Tax=Cribrihabitans marinus TaxID=1227549 RepID=A0A1H7E343_9RHOB|nr:AraC family transcriptional regulator [Cribrihabitans marinus]GGH41334.1 transcriptional regulator [Cribrihabitans marinus]SEK07517.1 transcriptional regulator, AraC family [Cribrihabitans marinus]